ncbi:MAG: site-2 protease family protein [Elusimicrobia bacterium]|nr:site-2 protease family protein [Elusimicrobiota bacterium]
MNRSRRWLSTVLSAAVALASPGLAPYEALALGVAAPARAVRGAGVAVALPPGSPAQGPTTQPAALPGSLGSVEALGAPLAPDLALPYAAFPGETAAAMSAPAPADSRAAGASALSAPARTGEARRREAIAPSALERLQAPVPDYAGLSPDAAREAWNADSLARTGEADLAGLDPRASGPAALAMPEGLFAPSLTRRGARRGRTPEPAGPDDDGRREGRSDMDHSDLDPLGNPSRPASDGPDSRDGEGSGRGSGGGALFSGGRGAFLGAAMLGLGAAAGVEAPGFLLHALVSIAVFYGLVFPFLILHEMGHAKVALRLGDSQPLADARLSWSWEGLLSHVHPAWTLGIPLLLIVAHAPVIGGAAPVKVDPDVLRGRTWGAVKVALAGPAVNLASALGLTAAYFAAGVLGAPALATAMLAYLVFINVALAALNLLPFPPFDGGHVLRWALGKALPGEIPMRVLDFLTPAFFLGAVGAMILHPEGFLFVINAITNALLLGTAPAYAPAAAAPLLGAVGMMLARTRARAPAPPPIPKD